MQVSARIDASVKKELENYCQTKGIVMKHIIQDAILGRLDKLADVEDVERLCLEPSRPLSEVLADTGPLA